MHPPSLGVSILFCWRGVSIGVRACAAQAQGLLVRSSSWPLLASCRWPSCHAGQFRRFVASRWGSWHSFVVALGVFRPSRQGGVVVVCFSSDFPGGCNSEGSLPGHLPLLGAWAAKDVKDYLALLIWGLAGANRVEDHRAPPARLDEPRVAFRCLARGGVALVELCLAEARSYPCKLVATLVDDRLVADVLDDFVCRPCLLDPVSRQQHLKAFPTQAAFRSKACADRYPERGVVPCGRAPRGPRAGADALAERPGGQRVALSSARACQGDRNMGH